MGRAYKLVLSMVLETGGLLPVWEEKFEAQWNVEAIALAKDSGAHASVMTDVTLLMDQDGVVWRSCALP